jgi:hypothetical protein
MRISQLRSSGVVPTSRPEEDRDGVAVIVVAAVLVWFTIRGVIPALIDGVDVGAALLTTSSLIVALGLVLLPAWRRRRARRRFGRL